MTQKEQPHEHRWSAEYEDNDSWWECVTCGETKN